MSAGLSIKFEKKKLNMSGIKATGKTIGEVENLTGIPKRELKYFIEQKIMRPSQRTESGYWLYSDEDIWRARLAFLCRELDFPTRVIRMILADPIRCWQQELERQIVHLTDKRERAESQLIRTEMLRRSWEDEEWAGLLRMHSEEGR